jgi:hypothetical protein
MQSDRYKAATCSYHLNPLKLLTSLWIQTCLVQGINISRLGRDSMFIWPVYCRRSWIVMKMKRRTRAWSENTCNPYNPIYHRTLDSTNLLLQSWADFCYINPFHFWPAQSSVLWGFLLMMPPPNKTSIYNQCVDRTCKGLWWVNACVYFH